MKSKIIYSMLIGIFLISFASALILNSPEDNGFANSILFNVTSELTSSNLSFYWNDSSTMSEDSKVCFYDNIGLGEYTCDSDIAQNDIPTDYIAFYKFYRDDKLGDETGTYDLTSCIGASHKENERAIIDHYDFDGSGDYCYRTRLTQVSWNLDFSVSMLIKPNDISQPTSRAGQLFQNPISSTNRNCMMYDNGAFRAAYYNGSWVPTSACVLPNATGQWHHIVWTNDNGAGKIYLNGEECNSGGSVANYCHVSNLQIGRCSLAPDYCYYDGQIDEVIIYDKVLTDNEVANMYKTQEEGQIYWNATDINGTSTQSLSSNFTLDLTAPILNIISPRGVQTKIVALNITSSDDYNVSLNISIDGTLNSSLPKNSTYQVADYEIGLPLGTALLSSIACDLAGNCAALNKSIKVRNINEIRIYSDGEVIETRANSNNPILEILGKLWGWLV